MPTRRLSLSPARMPREPLGRYERGSVGSGKMCQSNCGSTRVRNSVGAEHLSARYRQDSETTAGIASRSWVPRRNAGTNSGSTIAGRVRLKGVMS